MSLWWNFSKVFNLTKASKSGPKYLMRKTCANTVAVKFLKSCELLPRRTNPRKTHSKNKRNVRILAFVAFAKLRFTVPSMQPDQTLLRYKPGRFVYRFAYYLLRCQNCSERLETSHCAQRDLRRLAVLWKTLNHQMRSRAMYSKRRSPERTLRLYLIA